MTKQEKLGNERLEAWLASTSLPPPSPAFCARVMQAIETRPLPWRVRLRRFLLAPHTLRWNVAGTVATLTVAGIAVSLTLFFGRAPVPELSAGTAVVRFEIALPQARQVGLAGDFTHWAARIPLRRNADGTWTAEIRLPPGDYEYVFVVDDERWVADPRAGRYRDDGFGNRNAVLTVPSV